MTDARFPASPDEVGPAWYTAALRTTGTIADGASVTAVDTEQIGVGVGVLALLWRCRFTYDQPGAGPDTAVLKLPATAPHSRQLSDAFRFYEREVRFYEVIGHGTPLTTADRYFTDLDPESGDFVLIMEDFGQRRLLDQITGASPEDSIASLQALAAHHAAWWDHASFGTDAMAWAPRVIDPPNPQALVPALKASWPVVEERFGEHLGAFRDAASRMSDACVPLMDRLSQPPVTFVHGDHRLDNIFHPVADDQSVAGVDWQICGVGRGLYDVGYYMSQSLRSEVRAEC
ncbi:MAG TPA: phosphotransferase, partial [Acidimicrobiales bacterium]|nr:phosphotransferase [Acidimicrobiales bacterium]